jgi:hypothetical protein
MPDAGQERPVARSAQHEATSARPHAVASLGRDSGGPLLHADDDRADALLLPDVGHGAERILQVQHDVLAALADLARRLDRIEAAVAGADAADARRLAELLPAIQAVVGAQAFTVQELMRFAAESGPSGARLRTALAGATPKACGQLLARAAARPAVVRADRRKGADGCYWQLVGGDDFADRKSFPPLPLKLGTW